MTAAAASNWGLITNIVNSIVGVSVLTMPFCFKQCGIALGALLLVFCSWMTHQSCMFLVKSASLSKRRTYAGLALHAYGKVGKMLVETSMIGLMLGTCMAFYVVIGDLGSNFFARLFGFQVIGTFRVFLLFTVSLCIVLPLSLQRNMMASIQSFSAMALMFYTVFMFVIVLSSLKHGLFGGQWLQRISYVRWEGVFRCIPIFGMSFACQSWHSLAWTLSQPTELLGIEMLQKDGTFAAGGYMPPLRFKALTLSVVFGTMVGGIMIPNVETILGLTGATMGSLICFICPALIYKKIHKNTLSSQVVLWVGLGILVVSTHTTLSVSEEAPVAGRLEEAEGIIKAEAARLPGQNPIVDVAEDGRDKPKLPNEKDEMEQAQIKGPVDVPQREGAKEKEEEAQLDRPGQGMAVPMGEAHRHEPPVPHDKVVVDEGQDQEEPEENEHPSKHVDEKALGGKAQMAPPLPDSERERPRQDQVLEAAGGLPEDPQKVPEENGQPAIEPVKEDQGPGDRGLQPGPQAVPPEGQDAPAAGAGERAGGKAPLLVKPAPEAGPQVEPREQRNAEGRGGGHTGSKLEAEIKKMVAAAGRAEMLDHAVLLEVIKEQQVQQKRLLDQQEKLLAVIEEQHKEIHQQRQDSEEAEVQPEPGVAAPRGKEQEAHDGGTVEHHPQQPLEPALGAPRRPPAPPQGHGQRAVGEPEGAVGGAPAGPPGASDTEPRAARAEPREGRQGVVPAAGAGLPDRVPVPGLAEGPRSPEKLVAGELPEQGQDAFGRSSHERKKSRKEVATSDNVQEADVPGAREVGDPHVRSQPGSRDRGPAGLSSRSGGAAPGAQAEIRQLEHQAVSAGGQGGQQGGHLEARKEAIGEDHVPALGEDAAVQELERRQDPDLGPKPAIPGAQKPDHAKPNRELKVQAGSDLRRRRRDVAPGAGGDPAPRDRVIISFNPLPDVQVNDLRSALETQLHQAAGGALRVVHGRQVKQLAGAPEEP
ncbi:putative sodium-coupled neutral amino acid transporter 10 [Leptonychotes weddellii]|uniref:Sodium-coupled neutral amino acid transporter 10 n=1 Tax=Leptonychotes weddellii TaxID=9713 RepID=A0A7F8PZ95_LEPWE|nr:putative sodium-coupled neutral amino acid transporter 10 [Leptonychotes weddellii]